MSIQIVIDLQQYLLSYGVECVLTARFMGDSIENPFSFICYTNPTPTGVEFKANLRVISLSQFLRKKKNTNCADDGLSYFLDEILELSKQSKDTELPENLEVLFNNFDFFWLPELDSQEANAFYFLVGYCLNSVKNTCSLCDLCFREVQSLNPGGMVYRQSIPTSGIIKDMPLFIHQERCKTYYTLVKHIFASQLIKAY